MSERAGRMMRDDMEQMGPVRVKDVSEAQSAIVELAKDLAARSEIVIARKAGEEDELIY
jgi:flagellar motor switch protein FliG